MNETAYQGRLVRKKKTGKKVVQLRCPNPECEGGWIDLTQLQYLGVSPIRHECGWQNTVNLSLYVKIEVPLD